MAVTHNAAVTLASLQISISVQEIGNLGLDRMREKRMRSIAQDIGELIGECSWLNQLRDGIVRHGISLLQWRSGGVKHPHDMPPYRFTPSPTFAHSSLAASDDPSNSALGRGGSTDDRCRPSPCCATMTRSSSSKRLATLWFCQRDDRSRVALPTNVSPKPGAQR